MARALVAETRRNGGMAPVDLDRFWADQEIARRDPFGARIPQVPLGAILTGECVYAELGIPEDYWRYDHDEAWRLSVNRAYNTRAEPVGGRRLLPEAREPWRRQANVGGLHDVFGARRIWESGSWWLQQAAATPAELKSLLARAERTEVRAVVLPPDWEAEKRRMRAEGVPFPLYRHQRGPVTFACSVYGVENLVELLLDDPPLAARFRDVILAKMLELGRVLDEEAGFTPETAPRGFSFADDQCAMLNPELYEAFGAPVLAGVFARWAPAPGDSRYQHSDSAMAHHLPALARLGINRANFGPTVSVADIRRHLPRAVIEGALAPFTYSRNDEEGIVRELLRDFGEARAARGLVCATAGSINNGTRLTSMRLLMAAIQRHARYDGS